MDPIIIQLTIVLLVAFIVSYIAKSLKQPIVIGYIMAGVIIASIISFGVFDHLITLLLDAFKEVLSSILLLHV